MDPTEYHKYNRCRLFYSGLAAVATSLGPFTKMTIPAAFAYGLGEATQRFDVYDKLHVHVARAHSMSTSIITWESDVWLVADTLADLLAFISKTYARRYVALIGKYYDPRTG